MRLRTLSFLLAASISLSGCLETNPAGGLPSFSEERLGDTVTVTSFRPMYADTGWMEPLLSVGSVEAVPEYTFLNISSFAIGPDGSMYVADSRGPLREYSSDGVFVREIARQGRGPGEVQLVRGIAVLPDGRVMARDIGNGRFNVYARSGEPLDHWPMPVGRVGSGRDALAVDRMGTVTIAWDPYVPRDGSSVRFPRPSYLRIDPVSGFVTDTIRIPRRFASRCPDRSTAHWSSGWYEDVRVHYVPKLKWTLTAEGELIVGCPSDYEFEVAAGDGSVLRVKRMYSPVSASRAEREAYVANWTFVMRRSPFGGPGWSWIGPKPPSRRPAYVRILAGERGRIWVWPTQKANRLDIPEEFLGDGRPPVFWEDPDVGVFDVFTRQGVFMGSVRLPPGVHFNGLPQWPDPVFRGDTVWAERLDSLGVSYLTKYRIVWNRAGSGG